MPHPEREHELMIEVARLRQENVRLETAARAYIEGHELAVARAEVAEAALDAARREISILRSALQREAERYDAMEMPFAAQIVRAALAAPAGGEEGTR